MAKDSLMCIHCRVFYLQNIHTLLAILFGQSDPITMKIVFQSNVKLTTPNRKCYYKLYVSHSYQMWSKSYQNLWIYHEDNKVIIIKNDIFKL